MQKTNYYILEVNTDLYSSVQARERWRTWFFYGKFRPQIAANLPLPMEFNLERPDSIHGFEAAAGYTGACCLFRDDLLEVLYRAGVDNLVTIPALLFQNFGPKRMVHSNYKGVCIMGSVACLDKSRSVMADMGDGTGLIQGGVDSMFIDEAKTDGLLMFRPKPGRGAVLVHERLKKAIEAAKLPGLQFYSPSEWGGF